MPVIVKLPSGNWRAQVRRKGKYISNTFRRRSDADTWALETERTIDKGCGEQASPEDGWQKPTRSYLTTVRLDELVQTEGFEPAWAWSIGILSVLDIS
jgi:hypothetical protein